MVYAAIGGMQLKRWTGYFKIILPTLRVLKSAKNHEGCVHADTFKSGDVYFAVSVWDDEVKMKAFARSGLHSKLAGLASETMAMFYNHTHEYENVPDRSQYVVDWKAAVQKRNGKGTVGNLEVAS